MRVLIDMNLSPAWASFLRDAGFAADHWSEMGARTAADRDIMQWAADRGAVVLTADLDFSAILAASGENGPSVGPRRPPDSEGDRRRRRWSAARVVEGDRGWSDRDARRASLSCSHPAAGAVSRPACARAAGEDTLTLVMACA